MMTSSMSARDRTFGSIASSRTLSQDQDQDQEFLQDLLVRGVLGFPWGTPSIPPKRLACLFKVIFE